MILPGLLCAFLLLAAYAPAAQRAEQAAGPPPGAMDSAAQPPMDVECIPATRAGELLGKHGCIAGRVTRVTTLHSGALQLSLCPPHKKCAFHAVVPAPDVHSMGDLGDMRMLRGKIVALVGDVSEYHGHPQLLLRERQQLRIAADYSPEFDSAQSMPAKDRKFTIPGFHNERSW